MFCSVCGNQTALEDLYCGGCGQRIQQATPAAIIRTSRNIALPALTRSSKIGLGAAGAIIGVLLTGYFIAHATYGPSTPEALEKQLNAALSAGDMAKVASFLDPNQAQLKAAPLLEAFKNSLNDKVKSQYQSSLADARLSASHAASQDSTTKQISAFGSARGILQFVSNSNWRGTKWSFHVYPSELTFQTDGTNTVKGAIGALADSEGTIRNLWPSEYKFEGTLSNDFASQPFNGTANLLTSSKFTYTPASKTYLNIRFPDVKEFSVTLNDKPVVPATGKQEYRLSPAPDNAKFVVTAKIMGSSVQGSLTIDGSKSSQVQLIDTLKEAVSKKALDVILQSADTWVKATNAGDASLIKGIQTDSAYYKDLVGTITKPSEPKIKLLKAAVNPDSLTIRSDSITLNASEMYEYEPASGSTSARQTTANWTYTLQQNAGKDEWLITSHSSSWFGENVFNAKNNYSKEPAAATAT
ncbi:hypothetical protein [Paenibacillus ferrarius]|uniref:hypothetical protein n=1 Tax=Paenibacillus ferrarius TaxID=1469647 RepID=UPI003D2D1712